jgi:N-acetylglutamate synthase-like GNAT family acetyltransferase
MDIRAPLTPEDFERYYVFRHRLLRGPWGQPRGSERDEREAGAVHLMVCADDGNVIGVGRLHFNSPEEAQVRFMAVDEDCRGQGIGRRILEALEEQARAAGARRMVLDARKPAERFYAKQGYRTLGAAHTLFGHIAHVRMEKILEYET